MSFDAYYMFIGIMNEKLITFIYRVHRDLFFTHHLSTCRHHPSVMAYSAHQTQLPLMMPLMLREPQNAHLWSDIYMPLHASSCVREQNLA